MHFTFTSQLLYSTLLRYRTNVASLEKYICQLWLLCKLATLLTSWLSLGRDYSMFMSFRQKTIFMFANQLKFQVRDIQNLTAAKMLFSDFVKTKVSKKMAAKWLQSIASSYVKIKHLMNSYSLNSSTADKHHIWI